METAPVGRLDISSRISIGLGPTISTVSYRRFRYWFIRYVDVLL